MAFPMHPVFHINNHHSAKYTEELWQACAGKLVSVPKPGDRVWYFPQGHMEQIAATTNQESLPQLPSSHNLESKICCRVVSRTLSAEQETDEVYAQISLLPESEACESFAVSDEERNVNPTSKIPMFIKILTASDTSTHGGFSVLRKHAEECLPPLDMSQDPPVQDLVATDLHGTEWKFKHTYRGHPRRHLLTTGWSVFVSTKRLVAGDAVIFLRGDTGQLRVGIRRAKCQQTTQPSVLTSHSMHMGIIATASHAVATRTMFSVFYKPRVGTPNFLVPVENYAKAIAHSMSVGMRFKMTFETEDSSERSYTGTVVGISDLDGNCWPNSCWRSLEVNWDEMNKDRQDRLSPWEVNPCVVEASATAQNSTVPSRIKRPHALQSPASAMDISVRARAEQSRTAFQCFSPRSMREMQAQDSWTSRISSQWISQNAKGQLAHGLSPTSILQMPSPRKPTYKLFPSSEGDSNHKVPGISSNVLNPNQFVSGQNNSVIDGSSWPPCDSHNKRSRNSQNTSVNSHGPGSNPIDGSSWQSNDMQSGQFMRYGGTFQFGLTSAPPQNDRSTHFTTHKDIPTVSSVHDARNDNALYDTPQVSPPASENICKLFGISLTSSMPSVVKAPKNDFDPIHEEQNNAVVSQQSTHSEKENAVGSLKSEPEKVDQNIVRETEPANHSLRSCTKVIKKGSIIGRGIDLSKLDSYEKLFEELEIIFNMKGELRDRSRGWRVAYSDNEGDTMHVGDDPWLEFCTVVRKIIILSPEEVESSGVGKA